MYAAKQTIGINYDFNCSRYFCGRKVDVFLRQKNSYKEMNSVTYSSCIFVEAYHLIFKWSRIFSVDFDNLFILHSFYYYSINVSIFNIVSPFC